MNVVSRRALGPLLIGLGTLAAVQSADASAHRSRRHSGHRERSAAAASTPDCPATSARNTRVAAASAATSTMNAQAAALAVVPKAPPEPMAAALAASRREVPVASVWYDFKGARLGMSLAEWRASPFPGAGAPMASAECSDTTGSRVLVDEADKRMGVVECRYAAAGAPARIPLGERYGATDYDYAFIDGKLFRVTVRAGLEAQGDVNQGLIAKWGQPTSEARETSHNEAGAAVARRIAIWSNPVATIRFEAPDDRLDELAVSYVDTAAVARIEQAERGAHPAASVM
jgi:hypothetical protein